MSPEVPRNPLNYFNHLRPTVQLMAGMIISAVIITGVVEVDAVHNHHSYNALEVFNEIPPACPEGPKIVWPNNLDQAQTGAAQIKFVLTKSQAVAFEQEVDDSQTFADVAQVLNEALAPDDIKVSLFKIPDTISANITQDTTQENLGQAEHAANNLLEGFTKVPDDALQMVRGTDLYLVNGLAHAGKLVDGLYLSHTKDDHQATILTLDGGNPISDDFNHEMLGHAFANRTCQSGILERDAGMEHFNRNGFNYLGNDDRTQKARANAAQNLDTVDSYAASASYEDTADTIESDMRQGLWLNGKLCTEPKMSKIPACLKKIEMVRRIARYVPHFADYIWWISNRQ